MLSTQRLGISEKEFEKTVSQYSIKNQLQFRARLGELYIFLLNSLP